VANRPVELAEDIARHFPVAIVSRAAFDSLFEILRYLPAVAHSVGFECALGDPSSVDAGISVAPSSGGREVLAGSRPDPFMAFAVGVDTSWRRIQAFATAWEDGVTTLSKRVPFLFLEFDAEGPRHPVPVPSVFVALDWKIEELTAAARQRGQAGGAEAAPGLSDVREILELLNGRSLTPAVYALVVRCFDELPDRGVGLHVAAMLARPGQSVRLSVAVPRGDVPCYLQRLGWVQGLASLEEVLSTYSPYASFEHLAHLVQLDFDVGEALGDMIGVTLQPRGPSGWPHLLNALARAGLCRAHKSDALLAWPGAAIERHSSPFAIDRYLSHIKIGCSAVGERKAKAYFGATPIPLAQRETAP